jgi:predicted nucleic acid-binding protein
VIVADASVLVTALADDGDDGRTVRHRLLDEDLAGPELVDLEVTSVFRRFAATGHLTTERARQALTDLHDLRIELVSHRPLLRRCWDLRENLTVYDAAYVALAEALDVVLLTSDKRMAAAPGIACEVETLDLQ